MDYLLHLPALVKILVIFILIVITNHYRFHLGLAALAGGIMLALWQGHSPGLIGSIVFHTLFDWSTIGLVLVLAAILALSAVMKDNGIMEQIVTSYRGFFQSVKMTLVTLPMIIGLLPMPGGAIFSAPLVDSFDPQHKLDNREKAIVNYWFRHTIELWWPLYPAFIFTIDLTRLEIWQLVVVNLWMTPVFIIIGMLYILKKHDLNHLNEFKPARKQFFQAVMPIFLIVIVYFVAFIVCQLFQSIGETMMGIAIFAEFKRYVPILLGLLISLFLLFKRYSKAHWYRYFYSKNIGMLIGTIAGIKIFAGIIDQTHLAGLITAEFQALHIPLLSIIMLLPFITGLVTGVGFAYVGISFPIILALLPAGLPILKFISYIMLAGVFGYAGMMISPMHICMVVTADYFKSSLWGILKTIIPMTLIAVIVGILYFLLLGVIA